MLRYPQVSVLLPGDTVVEVRRSFRAPREQVWRAHTDPALVPRWMGGYDGWSMPVCDMDVRPGGAYRWQWRQDSDGKAFGFHGEYREVTAPSRLVHTEFFDPGTFGGDMGDGSINTIELTEEDSVTTLIARVEYKSRAARDAALATGMTDGMEVSYGRMDALLKAGSTASG